MKNPVEFLDSLNNNGTRSLILGPKRFVFVFDPKLSREILNDKPEIYIQNRTIFDRIRPITGNKGLVQLNGEESKVFRERFAPMFTPANMNRMKQEILKNSHESFNKIKAGSEIDITALMTDLVLKNAFKIFMGLDVAHETKVIAQEFQELNELCGQRMIAALPLPLFIPTQKNRRILYLQNSLRDKIYKALRPENSEL